MVAWNIFQMGMLLRGANKFRTYNNCRPGSPVRDTRLPRIWYSRWPERGSHYYLALVQYNRRRSKYDCRPRRPARRRLFQRFHAVCAVSIAWAQKFRLEALWVLGTTVHHGAS
jgi:hypothetical protein